MSQTELAPRTDGKKMEVKSASELSKFYGIPEPLMNVYFIELGGVLYAKEMFLLEQAYKRGVQCIEVKVEQKEGVWEAEAKIYPSLDEKIMMRLLDMPEEERKKYWEYLTKPTVEWGKASRETVRMSTMQPYLREMAIKRAVTRACRLFSGWGSTSYEEMPEAELSSEQIKEATENAKKVN
jgi:hypothetical protein